MLILLMFVISHFTFSQALDVEKYKEFLENNKDMNTNQLLEMYPAGEYLENINVKLNDIEYFDKVIEKYNLTQDELKLLNKNGFFVSNRFQYKTFFDAYKQVFQNDLPNYVSADLILYSIHFNFQKFLEEIELNAIQSKWNNIVKEMPKSYGLFYSAFVNLPKDEYNYEIFSKAFDNTRDYISITKNLIDNTTTSEGRVGEILSYISSEEFMDIYLFSESFLVPYDFSQFKVRGYYKAANADNFFKSMTWLGRTEIVIENGKGTVEQHSKKDLDIMLLQAVMLSIALKNDYENYKICDNTYNKLIGRQDNITPVEINNILEEMGITDMMPLLDENVRDSLKQKILELNSAKQSYSGNVMTNLGPGVQGTTPVVFKVFGQRPILDGYVTANTTYSNITYKGNVVKRWIPSTLDITFALGHNASAQLLVPELNNYNYGSNLAANRYLFDNNSDSAWNSTIYNSWLNILRTFNINDKTEREKLPKFAQTAAWNQKNLNTQLASWSQLRRDFLLSAKQPYTNSYICSFPKSIVEPNVEFFKKVKSYSLLLRSTLSDLYGTQSNLRNSFFDKYDSIIDTLTSISEKQYNLIELSSDEATFLQNMMIPMSVCQSISYKDCGSYLYKGWFNELFYGIDDIYDGTFVEATFKEDYTVADVHTIPQEDEDQVGKVLHAGVGPLNLAFIVSENIDGSKTAYVGPVFSYYEYITRDFKRLDEDEWKEFLLDETKNMQIKNFAKYYSSDKNGNSYNSFSNFFLDKASNVKSKNENLKIPYYPNPVKEKLFITLFPDKSNSKYHIEIFDLQGNLLIEDNIYVNSINNYIIDIDLTNIKTKGVYICNIKNESNSESFKFIKD